jgi:NAD(P)-dependent dehydrogenase (short-subunit alcohol dehydrogenase family)
VNTARYEETASQTMLPRGTFNGKSILITGGGSGLGLAMSLEFGRLGGNVVVASRNEGHRRNAVEAILRAGGAASEVYLDLLDPASVEAAFASSPPIDVLVNNAAANFYAASETLTERGWDTIVDRVLKGTFLCSQSFARRAIAARSGGAILNMVATTGTQGGPGVAASGAAKAGVINLTKSLAVEWAADGIRLNALAPGIVPHYDDDEKTKVGRLHFSEAGRASIPLGRFGRAEEIAWLASYLCSDFAAMITGQTIVLDGGLSLPTTLVKPPYVSIRSQIPARVR